MSLTAQAESVLTPSNARRLVGLAALRTGSAVYDDDLVGEALLRGVIAFRRIRNVTHPRAFFSKIVRDTVLDHWRRRREWISFGSMDEIAQTFDFESQLDHARQLDRLHVALMRLSVHEYTVMDQFYFEELSVGQISGMSGRSCSATKMALFRGRKKIIRALTSSPLRPRKLHNNNKEV